MRKTQKRRVAKNEAQKPPESGIQNEDQKMRRVVIVVLSYPSEPLTAYLLALTASCSTSQLSILASSHPHVHHFTHQPSVISHSHHHKPRAHQPSTADHVAHRLIS